MRRLTETKIVLVTRPTRVAELKRRFNTRSQAKFYVSRLGQDFTDYEHEDELYTAAVLSSRQMLDSLGCVHVVDRAFLPNFMFGPQDVVVVLGQDGLVANTVKYLDGQPVVGVNPDPARWDGQLLPFQVQDLPRIMRDVLMGRRPTRQVTMAQVKVNTGETLHAVNDLFIGPRTHTSARYLIELGGVRETQSSSGVIVSTGLGSTGWLKSLFAGALAIVASLGSQATGAQPGPPSSEGMRTPPPRPTRSPRTNPSAQPRSVFELPAAFPWDADYLRFTVREPFPTRTTQTGLVCGRVTARDPLTIVSQMPEHGVIFSDGIEADFLEFRSGTRAVITPSERRGRLVV